VSAAVSRDQIAVNDWSVEHVAQWLEHIQLGQYGDLFTSRSISGTVLLQLDNTQMKVYLNYIFTAETFQLIIWYYG
jgi:SAM domain (Sterile alpha motif)